MSKMTRKQNVTLLVAVMTVVLAGTVGIGNTYATSSTAGLGTAKITPGQAATIGINYIGAQPSDLVTVDFDDEDGTYLYGVEIHKDGKEFDVKVDPQSGNVITVEEGPIETSEDETDDVETDDDTETNDGASVSDGDGETDDDTETNDGASVSDGDGETDDDTESDDDNIEEENESDDDN